MTTLNCHLHDGYVVIEPYVPAGLTKKLRYWERKLVPNKQKWQREVHGTYRDLYVEQVVVNEQGDPVTMLQTLPGFVDLIYETQQATTFPINFFDKRTPPPPSDLSKGIQGLRDYQIEALVNAVTSGGGIISAPCGYGKTVLIAAIIRSFAHKELAARNTPLSVVVAADTDVCTKNYNDLVDLLKERKVGLLTGKVKKQSDDVQVVTFGSLHKIDPQEIGLLIVDEVHTAGSWNRANALLEATKALKWGVSATPDGRFDGADLLIRGIFGPVIYESTYEDGIQSGALVPVTVFWVNAPEPPTGLAHYHLLKTRNSKYTRGVEKNTALNSEVSRLLELIPDKYQTLCIMPFLQQMNELKKYNNEIPIVHGEEVGDNLVSKKYHELYSISKKERQEIYDKFRDGEIRKLFSTYIYKQGVNFPELTIMVCPGGGGSKITAGQIPGRASRAGVEGKDQAYMVDFIHPWDELEIDGQKKRGPLLADDISRRKVYEKLGFKQVDIATIDDLPFLTE